MDYQFTKRKTGKDKERRNRELYGNHSAKHVRIQEQCQENHLKNIQQARLGNSTKEQQRNKDIQVEKMNSSIPKKKKN
jgi:hypothetical protein